MRPSTHSLQRGLGARVWGFGRCRSYGSADRYKVYEQLLDIRAESLNSVFGEVSSAYGSFGVHRRKGLGVGGCELKGIKRELSVG